MPLWGNLDQANNAPKYKGVIEHPKFWEVKYASVGAAPRGNTLYGNTQPGGVSAQGTGIFAVGASEVAQTKVPHQGWIKVKAGLGPITSVAINAGGTGYSNADTVVVTGVAVPQAVLQVAANSAASTTAQLTSAAGVVPGLKASGPGVPANTFATAVAGANVTLSNPATLVSGAFVTFTPNTQTTTASAISTSNGTTTTVPVANAYGIVASMVASGNGVPANSYVIGVNGANVVLNTGAANVASAAALTFTPATNQITAPSIGLTTNATGGIVSVSVGNGGLFANNMYTPGIANSLPALTVSTAGGSGANLDAVMGGRFNRIQREVLVAMHTASENPADSAVFPG